MSANLLGPGLLFLGSLGVAFQTRGGALPGLFWLSIIECILGISVLMVAEKSLALSAVLCGSVLSVFAFAYLGAPIESYALMCGSIQLLLQVWLGRRSEAT